ncbi:protein transport protein SEC31 homolog B-like [Zingiber officinale]|uniref:protein transport protein SEC31 homolog B-like n=1 Tax=Zingiber officinale TaxID=94328 RepID=UPI001C4BB6E7|nr:protein transport protein SEC31 homolog B-like [Zingiber officinale]XP_042462556.1 protein transport protein SEC31 homolog B-like [Zingiber officinale]XP_042462557.1 protein transport protein SEC31 homolog B-like [Zingiber officinale]XP_042462559.1 protein transport protein SEC31 homolog B-like [Zingiber officinale]
MACIKSAARSALVSFAPDAPYLAAGTMAGSVDLSFSATANLEIFKLDFQSDAPELPVVGACPSDERFNRLSWGKPPSASEEYSLGLIAGGHPDGSICVWNPRKLISPEEQNDAFVAKLNMHVGSVYGLEFSTLSPNLLASGADEGKLCIWDLANPSKPDHFPSLKGVGSGAQTEVSFVSWNPKFQHILLSTSYNGITVIWDLRQQKPVKSFADSTRRRCSVLQWNPDLSTQLIVASDDDSSPSLRVWDVRKTLSPIREFVGHTKGVIAMSWCPYDSSFLLTCAKDNRTICWDTTSGEIVCELPASTNWNFDVHWYPKIPGVISASSYDMKVGIYNIQACSRYAVAEGEYGAPVQLRAPKWLKRPTGVSFGFGGKLISFQPVQSIPGGSAHSASEVYVHNLVTEHSLVSRSTEFEAAVQNGDKSSLGALCEQKSGVSVLEDDKETWNFLKIMCDEEGIARTKLLCHLGFTVPDERSDNTDNIGKRLENNLSLDSSPMFEGQASAFAIDNGEEFFNNPAICEDNLADQDSNVLIGEQVQSEPEGPIGTLNPSFDDSIQHSLVVGDYKGAVSKCIAVNRMADALVIAHAGGSSLWESTCDLYLKSSLTPYLKVVTAMVNNDLMTLVNTRPLNSWKETLALLCTFARKDEWTVLCDTLAARLLTVGNRLAATFCYICAGNVDRTVEIWSHGLKSDSDGRTFTDLLQDLMEKTIVLTLATGHNQFSASLSKLVENYAELLANQGLLATALKYLKLLAPDQPLHELAILRDRISLSAEEKGAPKTLSSETSTQQPEAAYGTDHIGYGIADHTQNYYQDKNITQPLPQPHHNIPSTQYAEGYHQSTAYGGYQTLQPKSQFLDFGIPTTFQPLQPTQMFIPPQTNQVMQQTPPAVASQPTLRPFVPAAPAALRKVEQYQQPSLGSQLYPSFANSFYQSGPSFNPSHGIGGSQPTAVNGNRFTQPAGPATGQMGFIPVPNPNFAHTPSMRNAQPSSPTKLPPSQPPAVPSAPPPTVQTADTSNVSAELKPVVTTLTRLYSETSAALGGANAHPSKKREIEDNSRKMGSLFVKLNSRDISPNAAAKLIRLCLALDSGDFAGALHIQVILTTSDWDECNFWLAALKRMIKMRQNVRI